MENVLLKVIEKWEKNHDPLDVMLLMGFFDLFAIVVFLNGRVGSREKSAGVKREGMPDFILPLLLNMLSGSQPSPAAAALLPLLTAAGGGQPDPAFLTALLTGLLSNPAARSSAGGEMLQPQTSLPPAAAKPATCQQAGTGAGEKENRREKQRVLQWHSFKS